MAETGRSFSLLFSTQLALGVRVPLRSGVFVAFKKIKRDFADSRPSWFAYWEPRSKCWQQWWCGGWSLTKELK